MNIKDLIINGFQVNEEIVFRKVSEETTMAFNPETGDMYELNDVSDEIISMLGKGMDGVTILEELSKNYDADEQTIIEDVSPLLDRFIELGILILKR